MLGFSTFEQVNCAVSGYLFTPVLVISLVTVRVETLYGGDHIPGPTFCLPAQTEGGTRTSWFRV